MTVSRCAALTDWQQRIQHTYLDVEMTWNALLEGLVGGGGVVGGEGSLMLHIIQDELLLTRQLDTVIKYLPDV